jgi:peptide/nickel transport system ATP-binding protein
MPVADATSPPGPPLLSVRELTVCFDTREGPAIAVHRVSFDVHRGTTLGIVGESGCGKTVTALAIMRLLPKESHVLSGAIEFDGTDLLCLEESDMRMLRGNRIAMIFQEPMTALNPVFAVGPQIAEVFLHHQSIPRAEARHRTCDIMRRVGIPRPELVYRSFPHELSGGLRQRVLIAMGLACVPSMLIADEPTTAIDVTVQAQILALIRRMQREFGMGVMLITHDLGVVAESCDAVAVMYASNIVEQAPTTELFSRPRHPYTLGLLRSIPSEHEPKTVLPVIPGNVPRPTHYPSGCHFASRCTFVTEGCRLQEPPLETVSDGHRVACWNRRAVEAAVEERGLGLRASVR